MKRSLGKMSKKSRVLGMHRKTLSVAAQLREFKVGSRVVIDQQARYSGMPHPRYRGRSGGVLATRGKTYEGEIRDGRMKKVLIVPSVHLAAQKAGAPKQQAAKVSQ